MESREVSVRIAEYVKKAGGRAYYVGGCVRDAFMGIESKDTDIEVHGIEPQVLYDIAGKVGTPFTAGKSFGILSLRECCIDIAMPRKEKATGRGHRDFDIYVDPYIGPEKAAARRDFTVNAIMKDVLTGDIIDPFGGISDIESGIIRHVSDKSFAEDPLRVLRAAQFAARFGFRIAPETLDLCRAVDISALSRERVEGELRKALLQSVRPSVFFDVLSGMNQLDCWFPDIGMLQGLAQDPVFHPEGDVYIHTMQVLDKAAGFLDKADDAYRFMMLALVHDLGKIDTTSVVNGRIHAYGHESYGVERVDKFILRITGSSDMRRYLLNMVPLHMKPNRALHNRASVKSTNHMFDEAAAPSDLIYFAMCDCPVWAGDERFRADYDFLFERYELYKETMSRRCVTGADLIAAGFEPGDGFSDILDYAHKLRLAGIRYDDTLKQTLSYAHKYYRK